MADEYTKETGGGYMGCQYGGSSPTFSILRAAVKTSATGATTQLRVIDVSKWQGTVDWEAIKDSIDGAIIRCGYAENLEKYDDPQWARNASECERLGIPYGAYLYSYATNTTLAASEAEHALRLLAGHRLSFPVFFDSEEYKSDDTRPVADACAKEFCAAIEAAGYMSGVYASASWWRNYLKTVKPQSKWVASWGTNNGSPQMNYKPAECDMWQYTSNGTVDGYSGRLDKSECYVDYPAELNPEPEPETDPEDTDATHPYKVAEGFYGEHEYKQEKPCMHWIQWSDGALEVQISDWYSAGTGSQYGNGYAIDKEMWFPKRIYPKTACPDFVGVPYCNGILVRGEQNYITAMVKEMSATTGMIRFIMTGRAFPACYADYKLEGRWK